MKKYPIMYFDGQLMKIAHKETIIMDFESDFAKSFTSLLALFFVFNLTFVGENEKILGFFQEALDFKIIVCFDTDRNRNYFSLLTFVVQ